MDDAKTLHGQLWRHGFGSVSAPEANFIGEHIKAEKPRNFVEIGTATGLSTVLIWEFLKTVDAPRLTTMDLSTQFFGDRGKPVGFLIDEKYGGTPEGMIRLTGITSAVIHEHIKEPIEMAFVDAAHPHPWPALDTLFLWPLMKENALIFHHDLRIYQTLPGKDSLGPKYLYDQFPEKSKQVGAPPKKNIFFIRKNLADVEFCDLFVDLLFLPWSSRSRMSLSLARQIVTRLEKLYRPKVAQAFSIAYDRSRAD